MKKVLAIIITAIICFCLCGCGKETKLVDKQSDAISSINYRVKYHTKFLELTLEPSKTIWIDTDYIILVSPYMHYPYVYNEQENRYVLDGESEQVLGSKIVLFYGEKIENVYVLENPQTIMYSIQ